MEIQNENQYREELLEWCNHIHYFRERMKPKFSRLFYLKSLEEWELACCELQKKLRSNGKVNMDNYDSALNLYEQWQSLYGESQGFREEVNSNVRTIADLPSDSDNGIANPMLTNDKTEELDQEWNELIIMANNLRIPTQDIREFLLNYSK